MVMQRPIALPYTSKQTRIPNRGWVAHALTRTRACIARHRAERAPSR